MNNINVFTTPYINEFKNYTLKVFNNKNSSKLNKIYLVKYKATKDGGVPNHIHRFYESNVNEHIDGDIIYLPKNTDDLESCIVMYGRDKIKTINKYLGALVSSKIRNIPWKLYNKLSSVKKYDFLLGWGLEQYKFNNLNPPIKSIYIKYNNKSIELISTLSGIYFGKELINIPSSDMRPDDLEKSFINFANYHSINYKIFKEDM